MEFKLDGKSVKPTSGYNYNAIRKKLDAMPDGELLSCKKIAAQLNLDADTLRDYVRKNMPHNTVLIMHRVYVGNAKTIKLYKESAGVD